jgi:2Fe-2S ferredoxin
VAVIIFNLPDGQEHSCAFKEGETILSVAHRHAIDLEGACEGSLACSTCHVVIDPLWIHKLPKPRQEESDLLDLAPKITARSRLGCQIVLNTFLDGLRVRIP